MADDVWTPLRVLEWTTERFQKRGVPSARLDAQVLLAHVLRCDRMSLYTGFDKPLAPEELTAYRELIKRRLAGEPVAYLTGEREFWSVTLQVDARVLIPRPETEHLVEAALGLARARGGGLAIADVATGSGAIAIALARELPKARITATDASADALAVARANIDRCGVADRVELREGDLLAPLDQPIDLLVSNPPYVASGELDRLSAEVRAEPRAALDGGPDGLACLRRLAADAPRHLAAGGAIALEHGFDQAEAVAALLQPAFEAIVVHRDLAGHARVTTATLRNTAVYSAGPVDGKGP